MGWPISPPPGRGPCMDGPPVQAIPSGEGAAAEAWQQAALRLVASRAPCLLWHAEVQERADGSLGWQLRVPDEASAQAFFPLELAPGQSYGDAWLLSRLEEDGEGAHQAGAGELRAGGTYTQEIRCRRRDGQIRWFQEEALIEPAGAGRWHVIGVSFDVTERKRTEEALRTSKAQLEAIIEAAPECIKLIAPDGTLLDMNPAGLAMIDAGSPADVLGRCVYDLVVPECREAFQALNERVCRGAEATLEFEIVGCTGQRRWIETHAVPLRLPSREGFVHLGISRDVTERKHGERRRDALQALGKRLNWVTSPEEAARILLSVADELIGWDACWVELFGPDQRTTSTLLLMDVVDGRRVEVPSSEPDPAARRLARQVAAGGPRLVLREPGAAIETTMRFGDTSRPSASLMFAPIRSHGRPVGVVSLQSYTFHAYTQVDLDHLQAVADYCGEALARTEAEKTRAHLEEQLRQAHKMEAVGRLAGGVAHEFNNMLSVILGCTDLALLRPGISPELTTLLRQVQRAAERASTSTAQLLAFSRKQLVAPEVIDLNGVVDRALAMLGRLIGEDITLVTQLDPQLERAHADPGQLEQALVNMVVNARDAMPRGGQITIRTENVDLGAEAARAHGDARPGPYVTLSVSDTGCGMDEATRAKVFEPFFTTKNVGEGTGLGLPLVQGMVKEIGGHVAVESRVGQGSTFTIYLPRLAEATATEPDPAADRSMPGGRETVLLVEDEPMVRQVVRTVLEACGYTVLGAANGREALQQCARLEGPIHLLVTDIRMPQMSGRDLAERVLAGSPGTRVLFMSGYTDDEVVRAGVLTDHSHFIQKPFTPSCLVQKVREVLDAKEAGGWPEG